MEMDRHLFDVAPRRAAVNFENSKRSFQFDLSSYDVEIVSLLFL